MRFTDIFIKRPVLATVVSLMILALGARSLSSLPVRQYPYTENAIVTVSTTYTGADPSIVAGFITTPLENAIAQANGIDYMTSTSNNNVSTITVYLRLNYDAQEALSDINTKVNSVLNQLPENTLLPVITVQIGQTIDSMYIGFYSDMLDTTHITDYLVRVVQPQIQAIEGIQEAEFRGDRQFAMRIWIDPDKLAGFGLNSRDIANALANNDVITAAGRTDGSMFTVNLAATTNLTTVEQFRNMIIKAENGAIIRLKDVARVAMGSTNYDTAVSFNGKRAVYIGILLTPNANLLSVIAKVKALFPSIQQQLPEGLQAKIVYDSTEFVNSSIHEVIMSLLEALFIVTGVIFIFLGSLRSVIIPLVTIPLSLIGSFFIMLLLGYSINLLTLLALVLAIGLVVDDAIIVVENIQRHMEEGASKLQAALQGARELANPIIAITIVLIAVYIPIGFMSGLTGALFTEFAFTLAGAVTVSAVVALTLSPMMCSKLLKYTHNQHSGGHSFIAWIDRQFERLKNKYHRALHEALNSLPVIAVFTILILSSIYFLFTTAKSELAPQEDQGVIISQLTASPNATLEQTQLFSNAVNKVYRSFPETERIFQLDGINGLNTSIIGMGLKPWDKRERTSNQLQPLVQEKLDNITGGIIAAFQLPPLPGARGVPIQFVVGTTDSFERLSEVNQALLAKARESGRFVFLDTDLKIDKAQTRIVLDRDKLSEFGLTMQDISGVFTGSLSQAYINYFDYSGRSYQVIPQMKREKRQNASQILDYYINTASGTPIPLSTVAKLETKIVPESLNHFQQLNSATLSGVPFPGVTMGQALDDLKSMAKEILPQGYTIDYAGQSRQFVQERSTLLVIFIFAMIIIFLSLSALFESFRDPLTILISVPLSICGAMIFISLSVGGASLNIYTEVGLITLIGLISKHGILIVQFANDLQREGKKKREAVEMAASIRLRPILMTTGAMVLGVVPLIMATGAGAVSRFNIGLVIASGIGIGTLFTLFVVPAMYMFLAADHARHQAA
ncbi:efflux RND transporter permease subunit [Legionella spiritensis]|uniref:Multidrug efflux transporter n=1 Tax=Legionella spiritensis TaxID=452 RepID=A0A0W0YY26_LEGSP|nr:efflux RND transporter permease subunit [Legionella spiritensis]KTD61780.1 multidrug efflux transporter [Legionella spiritensis]SNV38479.1 multidrug efflux transporter [Legionella spiritensis]